MVLFCGFLTVVACWFGALVAGDGFWFARGAGFLGGGVWLTGLIRGGGGLFALHCGFLRHSLLRRWLLHWARTRLGAVGARACFRGCNQTRIGIGQIIETRHHAGLIAIRLPVRPVVAALFWSGVWPRLLPVFGAGIRPCFGACFGSVVRAVFMALIIAVFRTVFGPGVLTRLLPVVLPRLCPLVVALVVALIIAII